MRAADNPFAVHRVLRQRYRFTEEQWRRLLDQLASLRYRAAIVGPHGSGKTTLLEDLAERLEARGRRVHLIRLDASHRRLPALAGLRRDDLLLCDGAEQLSRLGRWRLRLLMAQTAGLVVTTHRQGLLPTLHRCTTSPEILSDLSSSLGVQLSPERSSALHRQHGGNIREALRELYDYSSR